MSLTSEALKMVKDVLSLSGEVKRLASSLGEVSEEQRLHDRRITRLEAQWNTALQLAALPKPPSS